MGKKTQRKGIREYVEDGLVGVGMGADSGWFVRRLSRVCGLWTGS